jgi:hypothetical protein
MHENPRMPIGIQHQILNRPSASLPQKKQPNAFRDLQLLRPPYADPDRWRTDPGGDLMSCEAFSIDKPF